MGSDNRLAREAVRNVVALHPNRQRPIDPFQQLTAKMILEKHRRGELDPAILEALLIGVGLEP